MTKYVKYVGTSHVREITEKQWAELDPPVENKTLRWDSANGWTIPADRISDDAWPYIDADSELIVIDKDYRTSSPKDDSAPADVKLYPPTATAQQAELMDEADALAMQSQVEYDNDPVKSGEENAPPDQQSASVVSESQGGDGGTKD
jgi:hypothetical protein